MSRRNRAAGSPAWGMMALGLLVTAAVAAALLSWVPAAGVVMVVAGYPVPVPRWLVCALLGSAVGLLTVLPHVRRRHRAAAKAAVDPGPVQPELPERPAPTPPPREDRDPAAGEALPEAAPSLGDASGHEHRSQGTAGGPPHSDQASERATVAVFSARTFAQAVEQARRSVALEGGVYRIRQELYGSHPEPRASLRRVAERALTDDKIAWLDTSGRRAEYRLPVRRGGLAYDELLAQHPDPGAPATRVRVLEEQRAALEAAVALLLVETPAAYRCLLSAGPVAAAASQLVVGKGNALYDEYLHLRRYVVAEHGSGLAATLAAVAGLPDSDRLALLPAVIDDGAAYLVFVGSVPPRTRDDGCRWSDQTLIDLLNLYP